MRIHVKLHCTGVKTVLLLLIEQTGMNGEGWRKTVSLAEGCSVWAFEQRLSIDHACKSRAGGSWIQSIEAWLPGGG